MNQFQALLWLCGDETAEKDLDNRIAGLMLFTSSERVLLVRRSAHENRAGQWELPGGHVKKGESDVDAALREAGEELGGVPKDIEVIDVSRQLPSNESKVYYTTVIAKTTTTRWRPQLNEEHDHWGWFGQDDLPRGIHPGVIETLSSFTEKEAA